MGGHRTQPMQITRTPSSVAHRQSTLAYWHLSDRLIIMLVGMMAHVGPAPAQLDSAPQTPYLRT